MQALEVKQALEVLQALEVMQALEEVQALTEMPLRYKHNSDNYKKEVAAKIPHLS